jgi:hypothetical protein
LENVDDYLKGSELYEHGWYNHPAEPAKSLANLVRDSIKKGKAMKCSEKEKSCTYCGQNCVILKGGKKS